MHRLLRPFIPRALHRSTRLLRRLAGNPETRILGGVFAGLEYGERSFGSAYWPKRLGTYELELTETVEDVLARGFDRALVIGAAEGYYAVGLAWRARSATVTAWEAVPEARAELARLARINDVEGRVEVRGLCDIRELKGALDDRQDSFVLCDIEGGEGVLLDPYVVPSLATAEMLVETHEGFVPGVEARLAARFAATHRMRWIDPHRRKASEAPWLRTPRAWVGALDQLLDERRPEGIRWVHLRPIGGRT